MTYNTNWFDEEFVPSVYRYFIEQKHKRKEEGNEDGPIFISERQFNVIAKNCDMDSSGILTHEWDNLILTVVQNFSKKGNKYYTINFIDNYMEKHHNNGEYVLHRLLNLRESDPEHVSDYAKAYFNAYMELLKITEYDMQYGDIEETGESEVDHANELNNYLVNLMVAIKKFIKEGE